MFHDADPFVRLREMVFVALLTGRESVGGEWRYAWTEQRFDVGDGAYSDAAPPASGTTTVNYATDLRGRPIGLGLYWIRLKGAVGQQDVYEIVGDPVTSYSAPVGDGVSTTLTVTHDLGARGVSVVVYESASPYEQVFPTVSYPTTDVVTLTFLAAPSAGQYVVTVLSQGGGATLADVVGPASSTDNAVPRFDGTTGKVLQGSTVIVTDAGSVTGVTDLTMTGTLTVSTVRGGTTSGGKLTLVSTSDATKGTVDVLFTDPDVSTVKEVFRVRRLSTLTVTTGFGVDLKVTLQSGSGVEKDALKLTTVWTTATGGSETADLAISLIKAGLVTEVAKLVAADLALRVATIQGGTAPGGTLTLQSTTDATRGGVALSSGDWIAAYEQSAPATPAAGTVALYPKADGLWYGKDDAGTETALAGGVSSAANPKWVKVTKSYADFSAASTSSTITLRAMAAKEVAEAVIVKHSQSFQGGAISQYNLDVGIGGGAGSYFVAGADVLTAPLPTLSYKTQPATPALEDFGSAWSLSVTAHSIGANLSAATQGVVDVWIRVASLP